jgi:hypothetical protein
MKTWMTWTTLDALKAHLASPAAAAHRAQSIAERLHALRTHQTALVERERALLSHLQLAKLERDRIAADIREGEAWELAIAASRGLYMRLRQEADRLAKERAATERAIVALEARLPAAWRSRPARRWSVLEQTLAELGGCDGLPPAGPAGP